MVEFDNMTKDDALAYCYKHQKEYVSDFVGDGRRAFDCLISIIESGHCKLRELPDYGMDYEFNSDDD